MIYVAPTVRYDLPTALADHLARVWRVSTPHEPRVIIIGETCSRMAEGAGNWFAGNLEISEKSPPP